MKQRQNDCTLAELNRIVRSGRPTVSIFRARPPTPTLSVRRFILYFSLAKDAAYFSFADHVFDSSCSTVEVYESAVSGIVEAAMQGYNGTVFAYGATASGKTHTCLGSRAQPGIIIQAINDIFALISKVPAGFSRNLFQRASSCRLQTIDREYMLRLSYMEIYNEKLIDLLANNAAGPGKDLRIREGANGVILVDGLNEKVVSNADAIISMMYAAQGWCGENLRNDPKFDGVCSLTLLCRKATCWPDAFE